jgi:stage V sporulation protein D (sporulation-specific penicillin-binding protein)
MGQKVGKEKLMNYIDKFGFGKKTGVDLNGESSGILFSLDKMGPVEHATTSFGQGISVTPIQQIAAVSAAINGGTLYKPYIVKSLNETETNTLIKDFSKEKVRNVISKETSDLVRFTLESVVANGTGRNAYIENYRVGGKTGTAQKVENGRYLVNNYIMSFMSIVPANNPQAVFYIAIDNPKHTALLSSYTTAPIARRVLLDIIDALNIPRQEGGIEPVHLWNDPVYYHLPNVICMTKKEAEKALFYYDIQYTGYGNYIISQSPQAGTSLEMGSTVRVLLGDDNCS